MDPMTNSTTKDISRNLTPREIVRELDKYIIGQDNAKRSVAIAMRNRWRRMSDVPARTPESDALSRALLDRGFKFVGSTIVYAFMQAVGMVNDHLTTCPRHAVLGG